MTRLRGCGLSPQPRTSGMIVIEIGFVILCSGVIGVLLAHMMGR